MLENNEKNLYFGKCALEKAKMYIDENLPFQKFIVLTKKDELINVKNCLNCEQAIYICLSDYSMKEVVNFKENLTQEVRLIVGVGDEEVVNASKCLAKLLNVQYGVVETSFCSALSLLNNYQILDNGFINESQCEAYCFYYIDSDLILNITREQMVEMYAFICSKIAYILDDILSAKIFKTQFKLSTQQEMKELLNELNKVSYSLMFKENILSLKDIMISLSNLLKSCNYSTRKDKQYVAANMFCFLTKNYKDFHQICLNYSCAFTLLYATFLTNLQGLKYCVFDVEKRVKIFDKYFSKSGFEFDYNALKNYEQTYYILSFMREQLLSQCVASHKLLTMTNKQCMTLLKDGGFGLKNRLKSSCFTQALCFTPDVIVGENLVKVVKNYGLLDFDV